MLIYQVNGQFYYKDFDKAINKAKEILWNTCKSSAGKFDYTKNWTYESIKIIKSPNGNFSVVLKDSTNGKCLHKRLVRKIIL